MSVRPVPDVLENPATGERIEFRNVTDRAVRFDYSLAPGGYSMGRVQHVHPNQEERIAVREGRLAVRVDGDEWTATPGTRFAVPLGTPHALRNDGPVRVRTTVEMEPTLEVPALFETIYGLASDGKAVRWGLPGPLRLAVVADEFSEEFRFAGVPGPIQRALVAAVAWIGRMAGYRGRYQPRREPPAKP